MEYGKDRVVALVDMDCFYVQVEQRLNPALKNTPCVVAQYKTWKGGGIIAVSYEARAYGVTRNMWADDAKKLCPDLQVARVRESHGKADLTHYREASVEVIEVMSRFAVIERASIDEAYMDLTSAVQQRLKNMTEKTTYAHLLRATHIQGYPNSPHGCVSVEDMALDKEEQRARGVQQWLAALPVCSSGEQSCADLQLAVGALIVEEMRAAVKQHTGFCCSAGISHNKVLAKLACGLNKPDRQTVLPLDSVAELFNSLPISKIRNLGGKLGASITETLGVENMGELTRFSQAQLGQHFGDKTGQWLYDLCRGIDFEAVKPRQLPKSIGCSKNFPGKTSLATKEQVQHWLYQLALELEERLTKDREMNGRVAKQLTVGVCQLGDKRQSSFSRCCALARYDATKISTDCFAIIKSLNAAGNHQAAWNPPLTLLHISAGKFSDAPSAGGITGFLSSDVTSTQGHFSATQSCSQSPSGLKNSPASKPLGRIQCLFRKAAERQKQQTATEEAAVEKHKAVDGECSVTSTAQQVASSAVERPDCLAGPSSPSSVSKSPVRSHSGIAIFFQRKRFERSVHPLTTPLCKVETESRDGLDEGSSNYTAVCDTSVVAREHTRPKHILECTAHHLLSEEGLEVVSGESHSFPTPIVPAEPAQPSSYSPSKDLVHCERCGEEVLAWNLPEHNDFHFARDLQNSFSSKSTTQSISSSSTVPLCTPRIGGAGHSQLSRGKSKSRGQSGSQSKRPRSLGGSAGTLDSFFKR